MVQILTLHLWKKKNTTIFDFSDEQKSAKFVSQVYKELKEENGDTMPIPFMFMEDETATDPRIEYDEALGTVYGYCGLKDDQHKCEDHFLINVSFYV